MLTRMPIVCTCIILPLYGHKQPSPSGSGSLWTINPWLPWFIYYVHRFCQRVVPVTTVCHATLEDIQKQASSLLDPHFHVDDLQVVKVSPAQITL